jgi:myosin heavy subunit
MSKVQTAETYKSRGVLEKEIIVNETKIALQKEELKNLTTKNLLLIGEGTAMKEEIHKLKKERTAIRKEARAALKNRDNSIKQLKGSVANYKNEQERLLNVVQGKDAQIRGLEGVNDSQVTAISNYKRQLVGDRRAKFDFIELPWWSRLLTRVELKAALYSK